MARLPSLYLDGSSEKAAPVRARLQAAGLAPLLSTDARAPLHILVDPDALGTVPGVLVADTLPDAAWKAVREGLLLGAVPLSATDDQLLACLESCATRLERTAVFDAVADATLEIDAQGRVIRCNRAAITLLELPALPAGAALESLIHAADPGAWKLLHREISRGRRVVGADLEFVAPSGRQVTVVLSATPVPIADRTLVVLRDVTERRETELELRRTRDFLERLIDASTDAIAAADMEGRLVVFSRAAERLFGVSAAAARASWNVRDLYPKGGAGEVMRLLRASPEGQIESVRTYGRTVTGDLIPIELSAALIKAGTKEVATVGLLRDLRERVRIEAELSRARLRLTDAEKRDAVTGLAGAAAHELNQPLTAITGWADLARRRNADETLRRPLESISVEAHRMAEIVRKIASLVRVETRPYVNDRKIIDLEKSSDSGTTKGD